MSVASSRPPDTARLPHLQQLARRADRRLLIGSGISVALVLTASPSSSTMPTLTRSRLISALATMVSSDQIGGTSCKFSATMWTELTSAAPQALMACILACAALSLATSSAPVRSESPSKETTMTMKTERRSRMQTT